MRDINEIHSYIFEQRGSRVIRSGAPNIVTRAHSSYGTLMGASYVPDEIPPPLSSIKRGDVDRKELPATRATGSTHQPGPETSRGPRSGQCSNVGLPATADQFAIFDHHCKYSFMRSQLSRILSGDVNDPISPA